LLVKLCGSKKVDEVEVVHMNTLDNMWLRQLLRTWRCSYCVSSKSNREVSPKSNSF